MIYTTYSRQSGQGTCMSSRNGKKTIIGQTCFSTDKELFPSQRETINPSQCRDLSHKGQNTGHISNIRREIHQRTSDRRLKEVGIGLDLQLATRNLNLLKQGVKVDEVERLRKNQDKSDAEGYLQRLVKKIDINKQL